MSGRTSMLVLGGSGALGHKLVQEAASRFRVGATIRGSDPEPLAAIAGEPIEVIAGVRAGERESLERAFEQLRPRVVVNCIGAIKQLPAGRDPVEAIRVNSLFPHELAALAAERGAHTIQISTDCVFSGERGGYREQDVADARDLYGRSKLLGELGPEEGLTLRTSFIGRELTGASGLLEWLIASRGGTVRGFSGARFSGLTSAELARVICDLAERPQPPTGLFHVGAEPVSKHELLIGIRDALGLEVEIERDQEVVIDRSLDSTRFREATGWEPPPWSRMLAEIGADPTPYPSDPDLMRDRGEDGSD